MNRLFLLLISIFLICCSAPELNSPEGEVIEIKDDSLQGENNFVYREIMDDDKPIFDRNLCRCTHGKWQVSSISVTGGTIYSEEKIQSQVGKKLNLDYKDFQVSLLDDRYSIESPDFEIEVLNRNEGPRLKGTTFYEGYRSGRDSIFNLYVSGYDENEIARVMYLELISCNEIATYYDGRIYFYSRVDS